MVPLHVCIFCMHLASPRYMVAACILLASCMQLPSSMHLALRYISHCLGHFVYATLCSPDRSLPSRGQPEGLIPPPLYPNGRAACDPEDHSLGRQTLHPTPYTLSGSLQSQGGQQQRENGGPREIDRLLVPVFALLCFVTCISVHSHVHSHCLKHCYIYPLLRDHT